MGHKHKCGCGCHDTVTLEQALQLSQLQTKDYYNQYLNSSLVTLLGLINFDKHFSSAKGVQVYDEAGNEYLDFLGAYGALNLGHHHPEIWEAIQKVGQIPNLLQSSLQPLQAALARNLSLLSPGQLQRCFFCNSGTEAVEGALKISRVATGRSKFIYCSNSFHGKSLGALSVTGRDKYQAPFQPLLTGCIEVLFGDLDALEQALSNRDIAAFIVEPIQGEGGIIEPPKQFLTKAKRLCANYGTLLIADEIQTGLGRTGHLFACEFEGLEPDLICLAKSLSGGLIPIGAYLTTDEIWRKAYGTMDKALLHTSTFGGNSLACAAGLKTLEIIQRDGLCRQAKEKGDYLLTAIKKLKEKYPLLKDVRGRGLMIGLEFQQPVKTEKRYTIKFTTNVVNKLLQDYIGSLVAGELFNKHRIITAYTLNNPNVIRLEPPLTVTIEQLDRLIAALEQVLANNESVISLIGSGAKNILQRVSN